MVTDQADYETVRGPRILDPFGWHVGVASRIPGLGGENPAHDPTYVFHTPYVKVARGPVAFDVEFQNLSARKGTLVLRIHVLPDEPGAVARMVDSERIQLNRLAHHGGRIGLPFQGLGGVTYALMGLIPDNTDVRADGLIVRVDRPEDGSEDQRTGYGDGRNTVFGSDAIAPTAHMLSTDEPSLAMPVSQPFTQQQQAEDIYSRWLEQLGEDFEPGCGQWERIFVLQALEQYGLLQPGARGLGLTGHQDMLSRKLAASGTLVTTVCPQNLEEGNGGLANLPIDLVDFDFLWSHRIFNERQSTGEAINLIDNLMGRLRPGGLAIHILTAGTGMSPVGDRHSGALVFERDDVERLALIMISRGHEVARIRLGAIPTKEGVTSFAFIMRRARTTL